ncbi:MAG: glycosyltransferase [Leptospiraceae bacterium]|nr:glycosyltransferase [Leptospiraceae bacterium]MCB1303303.1 glycosyltransferase [Leptospiraceae bacterium]
MERTTYSIIVPAFNEAHWISSTLDSIAAAMKAAEYSGPGNNPSKRSGEIIVVDNNSTDNTGALARDKGARVVFFAENHIAKARNCGAALAQGDFLFFIDADTHISPETLIRALDFLEEGQCAGGGALLRFEDERAGFAWLSARAWNWLSKTRKLAAGCFVFCRMDAYCDFGGFDETVYASEDLRISRAIKKWGRHHRMNFSIIEEPRVRTSSRKLRWFSRLRIYTYALIFLVFPFAVRSKWLCRLWYVGGDRK